MKNYTNENNESKTVLLEELVQKLWDYDYEEKETTSLSVMLLGEMYSVSFRIEEKNIRFGDGIDIECDEISLSINEQFVVAISKEENELEGVIYEIVLMNKTRVYFTFFKR